MTDGAVRMKRRVLIAGFGDVAARTASLLTVRCRVYGIVRDAGPERLASLRALGVVPVIADLDDPASLSSLAGLAQDILHFAPPPSRGTRDTRTANLLAALGRGRSLPRHIVYLSTSGVYGDCGGAVVSETRAVRPESGRAWRRADAERQVRAFARRTGVRASILRVPGIYAADRLPLARLRAGTPAIVADEDSYTNHVHADDLARMVVSALRGARTCRVYNASDDSELKMGDWFDRIADDFSLPRPPRVPRAEVAGQVSPALLSFMRESRRLTNARIKRELGFRLCYPTVSDGLLAARLATAGVGSAARVGAAAR
jgi:nucleoside-diphosphate-sugar epimerase